MSAGYSHGRVLPIRLVHTDCFLLTLKLLPYIMDTVLVIEDDNAIRENTVELLEVFGFQALSSADGWSGLQRIEQDRPALVLCDILMPVMNGYEVIEQVRSNPVFQALPFYFMSAKTELIDQQRGQDLGATGYLTKPFAGDELLACLCCHFRYPLNKALSGSAHRSNDRVGSNRNV